MRRKDEEFHWLNPEKMDISMIFLEKLKKKKN
jgi:hypothetical protein